MNRIIYKAQDRVPGDYEYMGFFFGDDDKPLPMYFTGNDPFRLLDEMDAWLVKERAKVGLTAEMVEKRKAALAAARAARKAKKERAA